LKYVSIVWAGLRRKPSRTVLTFLSIVTAFVLYGGLSGTMASFDQLLNELTDRTRLYTTSSVSPGLPLPMAHVARIERIPGVRSAYGIVNFNAQYQLPSNSFGGEAFRVEERRDGGFSDYIVTEEALTAMQRTRTGVLVGNDLAQRFGWKVGDKLPLQLKTLRKDRSTVWSFDIVGTWAAPPNSGRDSDQMWVNYDYLDEARVLNIGTVNAVITHAADPAQTESIAQQIDAAFANSEFETYTMSYAAAVRAELNQLANIQLIINTVLSAVFFTLLFVTGNTMMQSVRERIPEFGILKTVGFTDRIVSGVVLAESLAICLAAALLGIALAAELLFPLIFASFSMQALPMAPAVLLKSLGLALLLALITALPPALRAGRLNVVDALARRGN